MATRTFQVGGVNTLWSTVGNWAEGAVPVSGDAVTIPVATAVTFDVDQSGFAAGLASLVVNGTFTCSTATGTYYLKMAGSITGTGSFNAGAVGTPLPADVTFTVHLNGAYAFALTGAGVVTLVSQEPTHRYVRLTQLETAGATTLHVDSDVTVAGDATWWALNSYVRIDRVVAGGTVGSELRQISSTTASTVVISAGLSANKEATSLVILVKRNITVTGATGMTFNSGTSWVIHASIVPGTGGSGFGGTSYYHTIGGVVSGVGSIGCNGTLLATFTGVFSNCSHGIIYSSGTFSGGVVSGSTTGTYGCQDFTIRDCLISGTTYGLYAMSNPHIQNTIYDACAALSRQCLGVVMHGGTVKNCGGLIGSTQASHHTFCGTAFSNNGGTFPPAMTYGNYAPTPFVIWKFFTYNATANDSRASTLGGTVTHETGTVPTGHAYSHKFVAASASYWNRIEWELGPNKPGLVAVQAFAKHDATSLASDARIHVQIIDPASDPLYGGTALAEWIAADSTAWQTAMVRYTATDDRPLLIRICQKRASGSSYARAILRPRGFAGVLN